MLPLIIRSVLPSQSVMKGKDFMVKLKKPLQWDKKVFS